LLGGAATLIDKFNEFSINRCVPNKTALKCAKKSLKMVDFFEDVSRKCEPSNVVA